MKRFASLAIALAGALAFAAADAQTLRWASAGDPQTMDPHSQNESMTNMMNGQVYERLTSRDRHLKIVPGLASEWQQVGPLVWRFKLRQGVKFHDGSPLTADDVVYSVQRGQMPTSQINNYAAGVGTAKKVDESTVDATLKRAGKAVATTSRTLSKDKKTMTVTTKGTNRAGQAMNNVLVFDRQ